MMKPGTMTAVGDMVMAAFPLQHEEMWTTGIMEGEGGLESRIYCRCGWIAPSVDLSTQESRFIDHLLELQDDQ